MKTYTAFMAILSTVMCVLTINGFLREKPTSVARLLNIAVWVTAASWGLIIVFARVP